MDGPISSPVVGVKLLGTPMTVLRVSLSHRLGAISLTIDRDLVTLPFEMLTYAYFAVTCTFYSLTEVSSEGF